VCGGSLKGSLCEWLDRPDLDGFGVACLRFANTDKHKVSNDIATVNDVRILFFG
jgi:hypothetical protein